MKNFLIAIVGPTASGKTDLAIKLAKNINAEIICCDSRQIYKEFDIATAKPSNEEQKEIPHHLFDIISPLQTFSAQDYTKFASKKIDEILSKGKNVIVVGGTGFYFRILLEGLQLTEVPPNDKLREELYNLSQKEGKEAVYEKLKNLDNKRAEKIHPNNLDKVIRAIEITKTLQQPMSDTGTIFTPKYDVLWIGVDYKDRQNLYKKINLRVDKMFETGLEKEATNLFNKYGQIPTLLNTIGYQEFVPYFNEEISLENLKEQIKQNTRRYAKRQLTWFRANEKINWFYKDELSDEEILNNILIKHIR